MNHLTSIYNQPCSCVYAEHEALAYPLTQKLLASLSGRGSHIIPIGHYMDLFGRTHQSFSAQKNAPALILAVKHGNFIYPGAPFCQDFGNVHFYYTSFVMNCPFDCEYCYLQGMYSSANIVLFVNQEDYFSEIKQLLLLHPVYLCISYDTDLLAFEGLTGMLGRYLNFAEKEDGLTTEVRTKSAFHTALLAENLSSAARSRVIMAYTLSPESVIARFEHRTPALSARLSAIREAFTAGFPIRLCFDPLLVVPEFETVYRTFLKQVRDALSGITIQDASIGVFRISDGYLKRMRKSRPESALLQYPFANENHVCHYGARSEKMVSFVKEQLKEWIPEDKIYTL